MDIKSTRDMFLYIVENGFNIFDDATEGLFLRIGDEILELDETVDQIVARKEKIFEPSPEFEDNYDKYLELQAERYRSCLGFLLSIHFSQK